MISTHWLEKRKTHWTRLETLLGQAQQNGLRSLTRQELQELGLLYRQAAADLSAVREDPTGRHYTRSLNLLLSRAHNTIYAGEKSNLMGVVEFFRSTYPRIFRRNLRLIGLAALLTLAGGLAGLLLTVTHPEFMRLVLGPQIIAKIEQHQMWTDSVVAIKPVAATGIMTNNITVTILTFVYGLTAGVLTVFLLVFNGLNIGTVAAACWMNGMSLRLWSFVAPHGVLELPAIFIAGGAGLRLAQGMLFPGVLPRKDALAQAGAEAVRLFAGTVPVLVVAGCLEGFVSPLTTLAPHWKFLLGGANAVIFCSYLFGAGRGQEPEV